MTNPFLWVAVFLAFMLWRRRPAQDSADYVSRDCSDRLLDSWVNAEYEWRKVRGERSEPSRAWPYGKVEQIEARPRKLRRIG